jgi:hypothetical protein
MRKHGEQRSEATCRDCDRLVGHGRTRCDDCQHARDELRRLRIDPMYECGCTSDVLCMQHQQARRPTWRRHR